MPRQEKWRTTRVERLVVKLKTPIGTMHTDTIAPIQVRIQEQREAGSMPEAEIIFEKDGVRGLMMLQGTVAEVLELVQQKMRVAGEKTGRGPIKLQVRKRIRRCPEHPGADVLLERQSPFIICAECRARLESWEVFIADEEGPVDLACPDHPDAPIKATRDGIKCTECGRVLKGYDE